MLRLPLGSQVPIMTRSNTPLVVFPFFLRHAGLQAAFLIPISVCVYTTTGGLKATFLSSYIHTVIIYVALCIFAFTVYATGSDLGSPSKVNPTSQFAQALQTSSPTCSFD